MQGAESGAGCVLHLHHKNAWSNAWVGNTSCDELYTWRFLHKAQLGCQVMAPGPSKDLSNAGFERLAFEAVCAAASLPSAQQPQAWLRQPAAIHTGCCLRHRGRRRSQLREAAGVAAALQAL